MGKYIGFSIDEISPINKDNSLLSIIPDSKSRFFPPYHLRHINISNKLLETRFLRSMTRDSISEGIGSVIQGGYYFVQYDLIKNNNAYSSDSIIDPEHDFFKENMSNSPYLENDIIGREFVNVSKLNCKNRHNSALYLYCFNVGQGDSFLLITSERNAYLIDTNIYSDEMMRVFSNNIQEILKSHNIQHNNIKAIIFTHKHCDHIRGANELIESNNFHFSNFIINLDYLHPTKVVKKLLQSARNHIPTWINMNQPCRIFDGNTHIYFKNPDQNTNQDPDINNSSIIMCVKHGRSSFHLTGDACSEVLCDKFHNCTHCNDRNGRFIKISHHGSRTGTCQGLIDILHPNDAFISAGQSTKYNHPHIETTDILANNAIPTAISKQIKKTVVYTSDMDHIERLI